MNKKIFQNLWLNISKIIYNVRQKIAIFSKFIFNQKLK